MFISRSTLLPIVATSSLKVLKRHSDLEFFPRKEEIETYLKAHQFTRDSEFCVLIPKVAQIVERTRIDFPWINIAVKATILKGDDVEKKWKLIMALRGMNGQKI